MYLYVCAFLAAILDDRETLYVFVSFHTGILSGPPDVFCFKGQFFSLAKLSLLFKGRYSFLLSY